MRFLHPRQGEPDAGAAGAANCFGMVWDYSLIEFLAIVKGEAGFG
jgi:hypothetical protein